MAKIIFSAIVDEIHGKVSGSVIQNSYGGFQLRTRVSPRNPQTQFSQPRRGLFGFRSASWRSLTSVQRQTFIDAAVTPGQALNLYNGSNTNLSLINEPAITNYIVDTVPDAMPIEITEAIPTSLQIKASGILTVVPAGMKLLIYTTATKAQTKVFTNRPQYSPIVYFDEGTDLSTDTGIITEFTNRFGSLRPDSLLGLQSVLIRKNNGLKGAFSITSTITEDMANKFIPLQQFNNDVANTGVVLETFYSYVIPANSLQNLGDRIRAVFNIETTLLLTGNTLVIGFTTGGTLLNVSTTAPLRIRINVELQMTDVDQVKAVGWYEFNNGIVAMEINTVNAVDPTAANTITLSGGSDTAGTITAKFGSVDLIRI